MVTPSSDNFSSRLNSSTRCIESPTITLVDASPDNLLPLNYFIELLWLIATVSLNEAIRNIPEKAITARLRQQGSARTKTRIYSLRREGSTFLLLAKEKYIHEVSKLSLWLIIKIPPLKTKPPTQGESSRGDVGPLSPVLNVDDEN